MTPHCPLASTNRSFYNQYRTRIGLGPLHSASDSILVRSKMGPKYGPCPIFTRTKRDSQSENASRRVEERLNNCEPAKILLNTSRPEWRERVADIRSWFGPSHSRGQFKLLSFRMMVIFVPRPPDELDGCRLYRYRAEGRPAKIRLSASLDPHHTVCKHLRPHNLLWWWAFGNGQMFCGMFSC